MAPSDRKIAGILFFVASAQVILGLILAEALFPGYSISANYISDLGIGPSSLLFNASVFLLGLLSLFGSYFLYRAFHHRVIPILFAVAAVGSIGIGIFTENAEPMHTLLSFITFLFSGVSAIVSYRLLKHPFFIVGILLGLMSLSAMVLFFEKIFLGLGVGGMERIIVYPILVWMIGFGCFLMAFPER